MEYVEKVKDCHFRSRLNEIPLQLKRDIALVTFQDGWNNVKRRKEMITLAEDHHLPFQDVGTGTNRFIIKYDGYVLKIGLDDEGINDNKQEWNVGFTLPRLKANEPDVALPYEISKGGHLMVADYAPAFTSYTEMSRHKTTIASILGNWSKNGYLLGDVGIQSKNFANWGLLNNRPVCIDYAYVFKASGTIFGCDKCGCRELKLDVSYSNYTCPVCNNSFPDAFLRARIPDNSRAKLFKDSISENIAVEMTTAETTIPCVIKEPIRMNPDAPNRMDDMWEVVNAINN